MKKIKIKNRDLFLILVIIVVIISFFRELPTFISYGKSETVVAEVVSVNHWLSYSTDIRDHKYNIYVVPLGAEHRVLETFTLIHTSEAESGFSMDISEMPELEVGSIVEIEYRIGKIKWKRLAGQEILKIKKIDPPESVDNPEFPLIYNEDFVIDRPVVGVFTMGDMLYSERIEEYGGYLFYLEHGSGVSAYWIYDEDLEKLDELPRTTIETGEAGIEVHPFYSSKQEGTPFVGRNITAVYNVKAYRMK